MTSCQWKPARSDWNVMPVSRKQNTSSARNWLSTTPVAPWWNPATSTIASTSPRKVARQRPRRSSADSSCAHDRERHAQRDLTEHRRGADAHHEPERGVAEDQVRERLVEQGTGSPSAAQNSSTIHSDAATTRSRPPACRARSRSQGRALPEVHEHEHDLRYTWTRNAMTRRSPTAQITRCRAGSAGSRGPDAVVAEPVDQGVAEKAAKLVQAWQSGARWGTEGSCMDDPASSG